MLDDRPRTWPAFFMAIGTAILIEITRRVADDWKYLFAAFAAVLGLFAFVELVYWLLWRVTARARSLMEMKAVTEQVLIVRAYASMTAEQLRQYATLQPSVLFMPGSPFPTTYLLRVGGGDIPYEFIHQFFSMGDGLYLCPVGTFSEGTNQRRWAQLLTNHLCSQGFAVRAAGNHAAKWTPGGYENARQWLGLNGPVQL